MSPLETLIAENEQTVYKFLLSLCGQEDLAKELTQETLFRAILRYDTFRGDCRLSVWLCQIAKNLCYTYYRKHKTEISLDEAVCAEEMDDFTVNLADKDCARRILTILHTLPDPYKEVFMLHVFGELSLKDISQLFHKSESFARVTYYRAKTIIIEKLKEENP